MSVTVTVPSNGNVIDLLSSAHYTVSKTDILKIKMASYTVKSRPYIELAGFSDVFAVKFIFQGLNGAQRELKMFTWHLREHFTSGPFMWFTVVTN